MTKKTFDKIAEGLREAISVVRGETEPAKTHVRPTMFGVAQPDQPDYRANHYGTCDRGSDCYHGKDHKGRDNGCLKIGWRGTNCTHWHPEPKGE